MEIVVLGRNLMQVDNRASKIYIYLFGATIFMRLISPNFRSLTSLQSATEARLKSWYSRVRIHSESIAFFGGGSSERKGAENITTELNELKFVGSLPVKRNTANCPGKVVRLQSSYTDFNCIKVAFLNGLSDGKLTLLNFFFLKMYIYSCVIYIYTTPNYILDI